MSPCSLNTIRVVLLDRNRMDALVDEVLAAYDLGSAPTATLLNISENITYQVEDPPSGRRWALRVYRSGYHPLTEIVSELAWVRALRRDGVVRTPAVVPTRRGDLVTVATPDPSRVGTSSDDPGKAGGPQCREPRYAVLFDWVEGSSPEPSDRMALVRGFTELGEITARLHRHVRGWRRPSDFTRFDWTWHTTLGSGGRWGAWRDGMRAAVGAERGGAADADPAGVAVLARAADEVRRRIRRFGHAPDRFGLVHADMRLANLLVNGGSGEITVIDFDDCGFSWYLYDLAASLSFIEHVPEVAELVDAWLTEYRRHLPVSVEEEAMVTTFVLLRRLLLVAWLGSHPEADAVASVARYAATSCDLADDYLRRRG